MGILWLFLLLCVSAAQAEIPSFSNTYQQVLSSVYKLHLLPHIFRNELIKDTQRKVAFGGDFTHFLIKYGHPMTRFYEHAALAVKEGRDLKLPFKAVNETCEIDFLKFSFSLGLDHPEWSVRFADVMFKIPAGLLDGNVNWFGAFDECVGIKVATPLFNTTGTYCLVPISGLLKVGVCVPSSCGPQDIASIVDSVNQYIHNNSFHNFTIMNITTSPEEIQCNNPNLPRTGYFYTAVVICSILLFMNVLSTSYDIVRRVHATYFSSSLQTASVVDINTSSSLFYGTVTTSSAQQQHVQQNQIAMDDEAPLVRDIDRPPPSFQQQQSPQTPPSQRHVSAALPTSSLGSLNSGKNKTKREEILLSFSLIQNVERILSVEQPTSRGAHTLQALHGIRLLSMFWVILSHTVLLAAANGVDNVLSLLNLFQNFEFQVIAHGFYAVDTFLVLGGFLLGYLTLRQLDKLELSPGNRVKKFAKFFGKLYLHRYIRLTPIYAFSILIYLGVAPYFMTGPSWQQFPDPLCSNGESWWKNLLYIQNLVDKDKECMAWTWYLAVDFQLFLIAPIPLLAFYWRPFAGWFVTILLVLASSLSSGLIAAQYNFEGAPLSSLVNHQNSSFDVVDFETHFVGDYFVMPWCRAAPWAIGLALGCALHRLPPSFANSRLQSSLQRIVASMLGWLVSLVLGLLLIYGMWPVYMGYYTLPSYVSELYWAGSRVAWGLVICWVIYACVAGVFPGNLIRRFLSWGAFVPLSRLTYCAYLFHPIIMCIYYWSMRNPVHMYDMEITYLFLASLVFVFSSVFIAAACVEVPLANLERLLLEQHDHRE